MRDSGASAASRGNSSGDIPRCVVVPGHLQLLHDLPDGVALRAFVGRRRAGAVAAQLLQPLAVVGSAAHRCMHAEPQAALWPNRRFKGRGRPCADRSHPASVAPMTRCHSNGAAERAFEFATPPIPYG